MMNNIEKNRDNNPFKVPENYFESVNRKILAATSGIDTETRKISFYSRFRPYILVAASVTGFVILSIFAATIYFNDKKNDNFSEVITNLPDDSYLNEIDISTLEDSYESAALPPETTELKKSEIIEYLLINNIELYDIYDKL
jgi:hypothetical protein